MKELLIMAKSLGGGGSEVALIELINGISAIKKKWSAEDTAFGKLCQRVILQSRESSAQSCEKDGLCSMRGSKE